MSQLNIDQFEIRVEFERGVGNAYMTFISLMLAIGILYIPDK